MTATAIEEDESIRAFGESARAFIEAESPLSRLRTLRGREQLRVAGGGAKDACRPPQRFPEYHIVVSPMITPAPGGANATSTLLTITNKTTKQGDIVHWEGGYEDTF